MDRVAGLRKYGCTNFPTCTKAQTMVDSKINTLALESDHRQRLQARHDIYCVLICRRKT